VVAPKADGLSAVETLSSSHQALLLLKGGLHLNISAFCSEAIAVMLGRFDGFKPGLCVISNLLHHAE
jgi:hypothetical protein